MNNFATGFLTGFMNDQAAKISERKGAAEEFFNNQMQLAQQKAMQYQTANKGKMDASLQVAKQMIALGVPEQTVMAIANQNPDDLPEFYSTIQKMQMEGVDMSNPEVYAGLIQIDSEFNPGNENITSLLKRIYDPLSANAKADPQGFDFDPKGTIWATMLGYNAMERAQAKLGTTEVLPGVSASAVLASDPNNLNHPLGDAPVVLNAGMVGDSTRAARESRSGGDILSDSEKRGMLATFSDFFAEELLLVDPSLSKEEREAAARKKAAMRMVESFPSAYTIPEIAKWLEEGTETTTEEVAPSGVVGPVSPPEAPTAPTQEEATPLASQASEPPQRLPDGSTFVEILPDGSLGYVTTTGQPVRYSRAFVDQIMEGQRRMNETAPDWNKPLGG